LESELDKLEIKSGKALTSLGDASTIDRGLNKVSGIIKGIGREIEKAGLEGETGWAKMTAGLADKMKKVSDATREYNDSLRANEREYKKLE